MEALRLGLLSSHTGSNIQAIVQACQKGTLRASPCVIISNNSGSHVLAYAESENIPHYHLSSKMHARPEDLDQAILQALQHHEVNLVVLSGYTKKWGRRRFTITGTASSIFTHRCSLGSEGRVMYGKLVHEAVLASGATKTGITIHLVDVEYDQGPIVAQCELPVFPDDTVSSLAQRILVNDRCKSGIVAVQAIPDESG